MTTLRDPRPSELRRLEELRRRRDGRHCFPLRDGRAFHPGDVVALGNPSATAARTVFVVLEADAESHDPDGFTLRVVASTGRAALCGLAPRTLQLPTVAELAEALGHRVTIGIDGCAWIPTRDPRYRDVCDAEVVRVARGPLTILRFTGGEDSAP